VKAHLALLLLLSVAGCAAPRPPPSQRLADLPPLPHTSIVAVLANRDQLELTGEQAARLEQADAELQQVMARLRTDQGLAPGAPAGAGHRPGHGAGAPPAEGPGGGRTGGGFGMSGGPGGFQLGPGGGGGGRHGGAEGAPAGAPQRGPARAAESLEARLDGADTAAFLGTEVIFTPAQWDRARQLAESYREKLYERRELLRGR
jgi:hypothetical protein